MRSRHGTWLTEKTLGLENPVFLATPNGCRLGKDCPWKHSSHPGKRVDAAAAPSGESSKKPKNKQLCRLFAETGKCRFGDECQYTHDSPSKKRFDKSDKGGKKRKEDGKKSSGKKEDGKKKSKKGRTAGAVAEVAESESESDSSSGSGLSSGSESSD